MDNDGVASLIRRGDGLRILLLGAPEIQSAGNRLSLSDQKALALLYYLAATGRAHTRNHLATLLWSELPDSNARHSLRSCLYHLHGALRAIGADARLAVDTQRVSFHLDDHECDVVQFRSLIAENTEQTLDEAITLHRGPFLSGFDLANAPVFEDWLRDEANGLHQAYLTALDRAATWAEDRQDWAKAATCIQRIVQIDPLDERGQLRLIQLYLRAGAIGQAIRQYQQFEAELERELHITPSSELQELIHQALLARDRTVSVEGKRSDHISRHREAESSLPFVGRDEILARLFALSHRVTTGGVTVIMQAESGMGKTRLVSELVSHLMQQMPPWIVLQGACSPFDDLLSYGPFYEALHTATSGDLTDLLTSEHKSARGETDNSMWRVLQALQTITKSGPLLLAIDDLHWANSSTLRLFGFLATHIRTLPILLVGTVHHAEAIPAVQRLVTLARPHGEISLLSVAPLTLEDIGALLDMIFPGTDMAPSLMEWLHSRSGGSPFTVNEILSQLRSEGILMPDGHFDAARWLRWRATFKLPATTYDLVMWRLDPLATDARHFLNVLAVAGQPLPFELLSAFPDIPADRSLQIVDDLLAGRFVIETASGVFDLPHHLLREALLSHLSSPRRRVIHRQLVEAIERCPLLQAHFPLRQVALHAVMGEDIKRARRYGMQALDGFVQDLPSAETLGFVQHLYDLLAPTASQDEMLRLTHALSQLHQSLGQLDAATHWNRQYLEIARQSDHLAAQATAHFERGELALMANNYTLAIASAEAGLALCESAKEEHPGAQSGRGYWLMGAALAMEGRDLPAGERYLQEAAASHRRINDSAGLCADLFDLGNVAAQRGDLAHALEFYQEAEQAAEAGHIPYFLALAHNNFAYHSLLMGRIDAAQQAVKQGLRVAERYEIIGALLHLYSTQGEVLLYLAEWAEAEGWLRRGLALAEELGNLERQAGYRAGLALCACGQQDLAEATSLLEEARTLITEQGYWHLQTRIFLWLAEIWLQRGQIDVSRQYLGQASDIARTQGRALLILQCQRLRARLLATGDAWVEAQIVFAQALEQATALGLMLEVARTQAAWGELMIRRSSSDQGASALLAAAREAFVQHSARADLQRISATMHTSHISPSQ